jgi:hypothetical protein
MMSSMRLHASLTARDRLLASPPPRTLGAALPAHTVTRVHDARSQQTRIASAIDCIEERLDRSRHRRSALLHGLRFGWVVGLSEQRFAVGDGADDVVLDVVGEAFELVARRRSALVGKYVDGCNQILFVCARSPYEHTHTIAPQHAYFGGLRRLARRRHKLVLRVMCDHTPLSDRRTHTRARARKRIHTLLPPALTARDVAATTFFAASVMPGLARVRSAPGALRACACARA